MKHTRNDLKIMQGWSLERKIQVTQVRIMEWYLKNNGKVFVSFSGGKDNEKKCKMKSHLQNTRKSLNKLLKLFP